MPPWSVNRPRQSSSRSNDSLGFDIVHTLSTRHQWFLCSPLLASHLTWFFPGLFLLCSRPWLLTTAAEGGWEPAPANRFRGAIPHRSSSYTHWALLGPLRSWRTIIGIANRHHIAARYLFPPCLHPQVEHVMQIDVRQQRSDHSPYTKGNFGCQSGLAV